MPANGLTATVSRSTAAPGPVPERGCIPWSEARHVAFGAARPLPPVAVPLTEAIGRILSRDVSALQDLPHYHFRSAIDALGGQLLVDGMLTIGAPLIASLGGAQLPPSQLVMSGFLSGLAFPVEHTGPA